MNIYELKANNQKSFYGKATIFQVGNNYYLKSYDTFVLGLIDGKVVKFWNDYSATTQKHINAFLSGWGLETYSKKQWLEKETSNFDHMKMIALQA